MGIKLRNKKTGEIADLDDWTLTGANDYITIESDHDRKKIYNYKSLAEFLDEWEDYKPKEPLIRHEGIRKTFRDWCVENGLDESEFRYYNNGTLRSTADDNYSIWFLQLALHARLQEGIDYTFTDLCGEEEE